MADDIRFEAEKRAHHNALERKRRDHIKDNFIMLREAIPSLQGEKTASRAQILKKAADYIMFMHQKNDGHQQDVEDLKRQNRLLEKQISILERTKRTGIFAVESSEIDNTIKNLHLDISSDSEQDYSSSDVPTRDNSC